MRKSQIPKNDVWSKQIVGLVWTNRILSPDFLRLQINSVAAETWKSLLTVKKKNTRLTLLYQSWAAKKGREVSYNVGDIRAVSLPPTVPVLPRLNWHLICFHMPRKFRHKKSAKVSKQPPPSSSTWNGFDINYDHNRDAGKLEFSHLTCIFVTCYPFSL